jgi:hypothetical protein
MTRHRLMLVALALSGVVAMAAASGAQARVGTARARARLGSAMRPDLPDLLQLAW